MIYKKFRTFLIEKNTSQLTKMTHLEHIEDYIFNEGEAGIKQAITFLDNLYDVMKGDSTSKIITQSKWDGCIHEDSILITKNGNVKIGEMINNRSTTEYDVLTHNFDTNEDEYNRAMIPRITGNHKKWIQVNLENGELIKLTEDHEVYTLNRGWVEAKELTTEDIIKSIQVK